MSCGQNDPSVASHPGTHGFPTCGSLPEAFGRTQAASFGLTPGLSTYSNGASFALKAANRDGGRTIGVASTNAGFPTQPPGQVNEFGSFHRPQRGNVPFTTGGLRPNFVRHKGGAVSGGGTEIPGLGSSSDNVHPGLPSDLDLDLEGDFQRGQPFTGYQHGAPGSYHALTGSQNSLTGSQHSLTGSQNVFSATHGFRQAYPMSSGPNDPSSELPSGSSRAGMPRYTPHMHTGQVADNLAAATRSQRVSTQVGPGMLTVPQTSGNSSSGSSVSGLGFGLPGSIWSMDSSRDWPGFAQNQMPFQNNTGPVGTPALSYTSQDQDVVQQSVIGQQPLQSRSTMPNRVISFGPVGTSVPASRQAANNRHLQTFIDGQTMDRIDRMALQDRTGNYAVHSPSVGSASLSSSRISVASLSTDVARHPFAPESRTRSSAYSVFQDTPPRTDGDDEHADFQSLPVSQREKLLSGDFENLQIRRGLYSHDGSEATPMAAFADVNRHMPVDDSEWACVPWEIVRQGPVVPEDIILREVNATMQPAMICAPGAFESDDGVELSKIVSRYGNSGAKVADADYPCDPTVECLCDSYIADDEPAVVALFRATRVDRVWTLDELKGSIVHIARDQHGSRLLQQAIDESGSENQARLAIGRDGGESWHLTFGQPGNGPVWVDETGLESPITEYGSDAGVDIDVYTSCRPAKRAEPKSAGPITAVSEFASPALLAILEEVLPQTLSLSRDLFGNYVIQKLLEHAPPFLRRKLANRLIGHAAMLATHPYGCRVVQRALDTVAHDQAVTLASELENDVLGCVLDQNGNHVIQKALSVLPPEAVSFVGACLTSPSTNLAYVARHPYGCRVLQRLLERADPESRRRLVDRLFRCYPSELVCDPYGNYVAQHVVQHGASTDRMQMFNLVMPRLVALARHKFGSNVIERLIQFGGEAVRRRVLGEVLGSPLISSLPMPGHGQYNRLENGLDSGRDEILCSMLRDPYANYVIQTLLDVYVERDDYVPNTGDHSSHVNLRQLESPAERAERKANGVMLRRAVRRSLPALRGCVGAKVWQLLERRCA